MKYAKQAKKDFKKAFEKYPELVHTLERTDESSDANKAINEFVDELGFDIYCEDYILDMCSEVVEGVRKGKYDDMALHLITIIVSDYCTKHVDVISDGFFSIAKGLIKTVMMDMMQSIMSPDFDVEKMMRYMERGKDK